jgi:mRNA-degrading endonuclease RelE of RelBE toxin-antitoxin system
MSESPSMQILVTPDFPGQLRKLAKRYRIARSDLQPLFDDLESGNCPGDQVPGTTYTVFKVRVKNSDIQRGKSGGYRIIYYLKTEAQILLVTLYSKSDKPNLSESKHPATRLIYSWLHGRHNKFVCRRNNLVTLI